MHDRFDRQTRVDGFGPENQQRLGRAHILVVGVGGLGSPAALYLAAAGVGTLGLCDFDAVEPSNLARQVLYGEGDVGQPKLEAARRRLVASRQDLCVRLHPDRLQPDPGFLADYDVVVDGSDNFATRYALNDACQTAGVPLVQASVTGWEGQIAVWRPGGPCLRCLHPRQPPGGPDCRRDGILGPVAGVLGTLQAMEALKLAAATGDALAGLLLYDGRTGAFERVAVKAAAECPACRPPRTKERGVGVADTPSAAALAGGEPATHAATPAEAHGAALVGDREARERDADLAADHERPETAASAPAEGGEPQEVDAATLRSWLSRADRPALLDVREPEETARGGLPEALCVPLGDLPGHAHRLRGRVVVHCQGGVRSLKATRWLRQQGVDAVNLRGGLDAWRALGGRLEPSRL